MTASKNEWKKFFETWAWRTDTLFKYPALIKKMKELNCPSVPEMEMRVEKYKERFREKKKDELQTITCIRIGYNSTLSELKREMLQSVTHLNPNTVTGKHWVIFDVQDMLPSKWTKFLVPQKVYIQKGGYFFVQTETGKVKMSLRQFRIYKTKLEAEFYQYKVHALLNNYDVFTDEYKNKIEKYLIKNKIKKLRPDWFI